MKLIRKITERIARRNPIEYARKIGVKVGNECRFTGNPRWGSEPWLIQVENHVLLSAEVNFVTHDAGTFLFRDTEEYKDVFEFAPIVIHDNCFIGPGEVWGGVPAHFIETTKEYADKCKETKLPYDIQAYNIDMKAELLRVTHQAYKFFK